MVDYSDLTGTDAGARDAVAEQVTAAVSKKIVGWLAGIMAVGIVSLAGSAILFYTTVHADAARYEELHTGMRHDIDVLQAKVDRQEEVQAERQTVFTAQVATLSTKIDTMQQALTRIQGLLDERLPPRRGGRR